MLKKKADIIIPHQDQHESLKNLLELISYKDFNINVISGGHFGENCNKGAMIATTNKIILLNDDTLPDNDGLLQMAFLLNTYDIVGSSQISKVRGKKRFYGMYFPMDKDDKFHPNLTDKPNKSLFPCAFCMGIRKDVWRELRGFDEGFKNGHEDVDFCIRAILAGKSMVLLDLAIPHIEGQSKDRSTFRDQNLQHLYDKWTLEKLNSFKNSFNNIPIIKRW